MLQTIFAQQTKADAGAPRDTMPEPLRAKQPRLDATMDAACDDVPACMAFPPRALDVDRVDEPARTGKP
jgi:hypothetical protein